jgi:hypothetical protein
MRETLEPDRPGGHRRRFSRAGQPRRALSLWFRILQAWVAVGLVSGACVWGWSLTVALVITFGVLGGSAAASILADKGLECLPRAGPYALEFGIVTTAWVGLVVALPLLAILVTGALLATHQLPRTWLSAQLSRRRPLSSALAAPVADSSSPRAAGRHAALEAPEPAPPFHGSSSLSPASSGALSDQALCLAWRRSFVALQVTTNATARAGVVLARQGYLDELTRRYPAEMAAWLTSGARAAGNPLPFISTETPEVD